MRRRETIAWLARSGRCILPPVAALAMLLMPGQSVARQTARQTAQQYTPQPAGQTDLQPVRHAAYHSSRQPVGIAFWDVDRLYDTIPALFYNDDVYTPGGRLRWSAERYARKVRLTAAAIDSMALPIVALWGVENEAVVRDIVRTCRGDYAYLHRTLNSLDGMDFALLYYGDLFFPYRVEPGRRYLCIEGALRRAGDVCDTLALVLSADERMTDWVVRDLRAERPGVKIVVLGRIGRRTAAAYGLRDATARAAAAGRGNIRRRGGWSMRDRIAADTSLHITGGDVFMRRYLVDRKAGTPLATYDGKRYRGGASRSLPVFGYIE